jgi:hypothetical protein
MFNEYLKLKQVILTKGQQKLVDAILEISKNDGGFLMLPPVLARLYISITGRLLF